MTDKTNKYRSLWLAINNEQPMGAITRNEYVETIQTALELAALLHDEREALDALVDAHNYNSDVFCNADCLERFGNSNKFWEDKPYSNRLYFGDGGFDYITRGHISSAVKHINSEQPNTSQLFKDLKEML